MPIVHVPRMEAGQEVTEPRPADLAEHARADPQIGHQQPPGAKSGDPILAHELLANPSHLDGAEPETGDLWRWHAVEEIEHKGVAYDTWLHATRHWPRGKRWKVKAKVMFLVTRNFVVDRTAGALELMRQDGVTGLHAWSLLLWYLWVRPGMFRKIAGAWLKFFLPGFHPWNVDDRHLLGAYAKLASGSESKRKVRWAT